MQFGNVPTNISATCIGIFRLLHGVFLQFCFTGCKGCCFFLLLLLSTKFEVRIRRHKDIRLQKRLGCLYYGDSTWLVPASQSHSLQGTAAVHSGYQDTVEAIREERKSVCKERERVWLASVSPCESHELCDVRHVGVSDVLSGSQRCLSTNTVTQSSTVTVQLIALIYMCPLRQLALQDWIWLVCFELI